MGPPCRRRRRVARVMSGTLWLVATPIGNLGDLPPRAIEVLQSCALVCCEDTRRTGRLLQHAGIHVERLAVTNEHTEFHRIDDVLAVLGNGDDVAVVTDAGTPGISDPGERLAAAAISAGYDVAAVPGPVAAITALIISGLPCDRFVFEGFLPRSGRERNERVASVATEARTTVLYEAPHRIERTIADLVTACGADRPVAVCRELTKLYDTVLRGPIGEIEIGAPKGEYVIVLGGAPPTERPATDDEIVEALNVQISGGASTRDAVDTVASLLSAPRKLVYSLAIANR
jgi:16S rRNA (cytidine1402-2'-O)-methyltransferase